MALAKDQLNSFQTSSYSENLHTLHGFEHGYHKIAIEEGNLTSFKGGHDGLIIRNLGMRTSSSPLGSPSSANSNEFAFQVTPYLAKEAHPLVNYKATYDSLIQASNGSILRFQQDDQIPQTTSIGEQYSSWDGNLSYCQLWNQMNQKSSPEVRLFNDLNSFQTASNFSSLVDTSKENNANWLYSEATIVADSIQEPGLHEAGNLQKRPNSGDSVQATKKICKSPSPTMKQKPKTISPSPSKDPQSIAAKQRRERISARLKILQDLVPNGSKVDLVTMLEKAINYVKFLQWQVKVLATDEFWPAQSGKAPDIAQVKEAIDTILSSQRDRNSSSSSK